MLCINWKIPDDGFQFFKGAYSSENSAIPPTPGLFW